MIQKEKDLLLKDLCARLPYGVKLETLEGPQKFDIRWLSINMCNIANPYLPYLFPISSMTEEQREELMFISEIRITFTPDRIIEVYKNTIEWFLKNHIDYNNLIGKGLAIDATNLNIY